MFTLGAYHSREDLVLWSELVALSARDPKVRQRLHALWTQRRLPDLEHQLAAQYPAAGQNAIGAAACALACLFEAHWTFHLQDRTALAFVFSSYLLAIAPSFPQRKVCTKPGTIH